MRMLLNYYDVGIERIYRLYITVHRQASYHAIRSERFAGSYQPGEVSRAALSGQLVCLRRSHNFNFIPRHTERQISTGGSVHLPG